MQSLRKGDVIIIVVWLLPTLLMLLLGVFALLGWGHPTAQPGQATGTVATETAREQLIKLQRDNDRSFSAWFWNSSATLGTIVAALLAVAGVLATVVSNFRQWTKSQEMQHKKELADRQETQDKDLKDKAEERFKTAVTVLGDEKEGTQVGGAILLRSFLNPGGKKDYERYYTQIFDLAVSYLRLPRTPPLSEDQHGIPCSPENLQRSAGSSVLRILSVSRLPQTAVAVVC